MDIHVVDQFAQKWIAFLGIPAIFLVARKNKWGFIFGIAVQPLWYITTYVHHQWWIMLGCVFYTGNWIYGAWNWFRHPPAKNTQGKIRITRAPRMPGCPETSWMNNFWVGIELPCIFFGLAAGPEGVAYYVPQDQALKILAKKNPPIAEAWEREGYPQPGRCFAFPPEGVLELEPIPQAREAWVREARPSLTLRK